MGIPPGHQIILEDSAAGFQRGNSEETLGDSAAPCCKPAKTMCGRNARNEVRSPADTPRLKSLQVQFGCRLSVGILSARKWIATFPADH
jgi:hypothetical protein